jgi:hypothetical protein
MMDNKQCVAVDETPARKSEEVLVARGIVGCARCLGNHAEIKMKPFTFPAGDFSHWGMCPRKHDPVLFRVISNAEGGE